MRRRTAGQGPLIVSSVENRSLYALQENVGFSNTIQGITSLKKDRIVKKVSIRQTQKGNDKYKTHVHSLYFHRSSFDEYNGYIKL